MRSEATSDLDVLLRLPLTSANCQSTCLKVLIAIMSLTGLDTIAIHHLVL